MKSSPGLRLSASTCINAASWQNGDTARCGTAHRQESKWGESLALNNSDQEGAGWIVESSFNKRPGKL